MTNPTDIKKTLVLEGTGKTGRRVAQRLAARGVPTRIGSRVGGPPFDWEVRELGPVLHAHYCIRLDPKAPVIAWRLL